MYTVVTKEKELQRVQLTSTGNRNRQSSKEIKVRRDSNRDHSFLLIVGLKVGPGMKGIYITFEPNLYWMRANGTVVARPIRIRKVGGSIPPSSSSVLVYILLLNSFVLFKIHDHYFYSCTPFFFGTAQKSIRIDTQFNLFIFIFNRYQP